jgi:Mor family transcriptional regulator
MLFTSETYKPSPMILLAQRNEKIVMAFNHINDISKIAKAFNLSPVQIRRILKSNKDKIRRVEVSV